MKTETKVLGIIFFVVIVLVFGAVFLLGGNSSKNENGQILNIDYSKGQKIGSDSAKVRLVEFSDFQCPACLAAEPVLKRIRSSDNVQLIYRHFPLTRHTNGRKAAYLSEAAGEEGKFWEMHDKIFDTQNQWTDLSEKDVNAFFLSLTKDLGLNEEKARQAITKGDAVKAKVDADQAEGLSLKVNATPTFFLNGQKMNLQDFSQMVTIIEGELKK